MNHQEQYFSAIYSDFQNKIQIIADLVRDHPGEHGGVVERAISELIRLILPARYSVGSGFVVDSLGRRSRQCDVVVYDALSSFDVFGYGGRFLYPFESVHAVIEVKKTLNKRSVVAACRNIASVRKLNSSASSELRVVRALDGTVEYRDYYPKSPAGIIIGYHSDTHDLLTIKSWLTAALGSTPNPDHHPDLAISILEGFKFLYTLTSHVSGSEQYKFYPLQARDESGIVQRGPDGGASVVSLPKEDVGTVETEFVPLVNGYAHNRQCKPVIHPKQPDVYTMADDARLLMTSISSIAKILSSRTSTESVIDKYFSPFYSEAIAI